MKLKHFSGMLIATSDPEEILSAQTRVREMRARFKKEFPDTTFSGEILWSDKTEHWYDQGDEWPDEWWKYGHQIRIKYQARSMATWNAIYEKANAIYPHYIKRGW